MGACPAPFLCGRLLCACLDSLNYEISVPCGQYPVRSICMSRCAPGGCLSDGSKHLSDRQVDEALHPNSHFCTVLWKWACLFSPNQIGEYASVFLVLCGGSSCLREVHLFLRFSAEMAAAAKCKYLLWRDVLQNNCWTPEACLKKTVSQIVTMNVLATVIQILMLVFYFDLTLPLSPPLFFPALLSFTFWEVVCAKSK